jgi:hypothetical protein
MTEILQLSNLTTEVDDFITQFNADLATRGVWKGQLTTQTSQTIIEYISTVGALDTSKIIRASEDAFAETALADSAILSITAMQGLRITRMLPAEVTVQLTSTTTVTLGPMTQFTIAGISFFNQEQISITANATVNATLAQGTVTIYSMNGLGVEFQNFVSPDDSFVVSDQDVMVLVNGSVIPKSFGELWNYPSQPAYADLTLPDGRLNIQFGNSSFGSMPGVNDVVTVVYAVTNGADTNTAVTQSQPVSVSGFPQITGTATANPTGGSAQQSTLVYKNVASGSFGTYQSAVTKSQYVALVNTYPGIVDAITQAQREIDPNDPTYMNVIRVSALTSSPWTQAQQTAFLQYLQSISMYSTRFMWFNAIPIPITVDIDVYCFNTATLSQVQATSQQAINAMFAPQPGILMTNFYLSDFDATIKNANNGLVDHITVNSPTSDMIVTAPDAATVTWAVINGSGTLGPLVYNYSVAVTNSLDVGPPNVWINPQITGTATNNSIQLTWNEVPGALSYRIYGRESGALGLIATVTAVAGGPPQVYVDNGSITPTGGLPDTLSLSPIRYNQLAALTINVYYSDRQQKLPSGVERVTNN